MPEIGDVIELTSDIQGKKLIAGMQGTIVHCYDTTAYEVEFTNEKGETTELSALSPNQFVVVWEIRNRQWVPVSDQLMALVKKLPETSVKKVFDFARLLSVHPIQKIAA